MMLSLSPGETPLAQAGDVARNANMWRISDDFWDTWPALQEQFERLKNWAPYRKPGAWPDADMLPLGVLEMGKRTTRFTQDEQRTLMTLWSIARSPLIMGGDLRKLDDLTASLLTNDEVLAVNRASDGNRELFSRERACGVDGKGGYEPLRRAVQPARRRVRRSSEFRQGRFQQRDARARPLAGPRSRHLPRNVRAADAAARCGIVSTNHNHSPWPGLTGHPSEKDSLAPADAGALGAASRAAW